jgi:hypothetical protein
MQDLHPNLNVNRGVPTRITSERPLFQKGQKVRNSEMKYWQENEKKQQELI